MRSGRASLLHNNDTGLQYYRLVCRSAIRAYRHLPPGHAEEEGISPSEIYSADRVNPPPRLEELSNRKKPTMTFHLWNEDPTVFQWIALEPIHFHPISERVKKPDNTGSVYVIHGNHHNPFFSCLDSIIGLFVSIVQAERQSVARTLGAM